MSPSELHPTSGVTPREELWNALTHGLGILLAIAGLVLTVVFASLARDPWLIVAGSLYGAAMVLLYLSSTLYHSARDLKWKRRFLLADHACIYLLIAGTYTPFALGPLRGGFGWTLFGIIWGCALLGVFKEFFYARRGTVISALIYLVMGWFSITAIVPLFASMSLLGVLLLILGGVAYSLGVIFYLWRSLAYSHAIWHLWVVAGSVLHFFSILTLVV